MTTSRACRDREEILILDAAGELTAGQAAEEWAAHLLHCEGCRRERAELARLFDGLRRVLPAPELGPARSAAMIAAVRRSIPGARRAPAELWRRWVPAFAAACTVLFVVAAGVALKDRGFSPWGGGDLLQTQALSDQEREIISNLDLLENLGTIEKLVQVVDDAGGDPPAPAGESETQGARRSERLELFLS
jgi:hypothetical protein